MESELSGMKADKLWLSAAGTRAFPAETVTVGTRRARNESADDHLKTMAANSLPKAPSVRHVNNSEY